MTWRPVYRETLQQEQANDSESTRRRRETHPGKKGLLPVIGALHRVPSDTHTGRGLSSTTVG